MTLNKRDTARKIAQHTDLTHRQAEEAVEALITLWSDELASGGKIAIDNFLVLEVKAIYRDKRLHHQQIILRTSRTLKTRLALWRK